MLKELSIRDFKLLRDVHLNFGDGLTVLTGETGAGKTQCLEALIAAMGDRLGDEVVSKGAEKGEITAVFDVSKHPEALEILTSEGWLDDDETEVVLERTIEKGGRSKARLNGRRVPIGTLQAVSGRLVDLLGQNARADILSRPSLEILDSMGDRSHQKKLQKTHNLHGTWQEAKEEYRREREAIARANERRELVEYQYSELEKARLRHGEEMELTHEGELLETARERIEDAGRAAKILVGDDKEEPCARDLLQEALDALNNLMASDVSLKGEYLRLREMVYLSDELAQMLRRYEDKIIDDPERRAVVESRLATIHNLKRKYRLDEDGLIGLRERLAEELEMVETAMDRMEDLGRQRDKARENYKKEAEELSNLREKLGKRISKELRKHLKDLDLPNTTFTVKQETYAEDEGKYRADGYDRVELLIATNPAQEPAPLKKVASGGELSRLLIALKTVLANRDRVPVLVFDEAEAGIGGETAFKVGEKLVELSESHQLILVSHLPQIASQGKGHWLIEKISTRKDTRAEAKEVKGEERVEEISRMLGARGDRKALQKLARSFLKG